MQRSANYALVGFASTVLVIGLIGFSLWLAAFRFGQTYVTYDILFKEPVRGLSEGGQVHFNGIKVGEVTSILRDETNPTQVIVRAEVTSDVPIRVDSYAMLEPQGLTGVNYVQITAGIDNKLLKDTVVDGMMPPIPTQPSASLAELLERIKRVLSDENIKRVSDGLEDLEAVTSVLRDHKSIIAEAESTIANANRAAQEFEELIKSTNVLFSGDGHRLIVKIGDAATEIESATNDLHKLIGKLDGPMGNFASTGLPQITSAIGSLQQATDNLNRLLNELQQSPQGLIAKPPALEMEVMP